MNNPPLPNTRLVRFGIVVAVLVASTLFWYLFFLYMSSFDNEKTGLQYDNISNQSYSMDEVNSNSVVNPNAPFFIGFEALQRYGVSFDEDVYIRDAISNYVINEMGVSSAKISYVDKSFRGPVVSSENSVYSFKYFVNERDEFTVSSTSNVIKETIKVSISQGDKTVFEKQFDIFQPI